LAAQAQQKMSPPTAILYSRSVILPLLTGAEKGCEFKYLVIGLEKLGFAREVGVKVIYHVPTPPVSEVLYDA